MGISLIAGGAGFIGYHLSKYLLNKGETVLIVDNLSNSIYKNFEELKTFNNLYIYEESLDRRLFIIEYSKKLEEYGISTIDTIYNLTSSSEKEIYKNDPIKTLDSCYIGTRNLLGLAQKHKSKFIQLSSDEIDNLTSGRIEGLRIAELLSIEFYKKHNINTKILRLPEIYGTRMKLENKFICQIIKHIINNEKIIISENETTIHVCAFVNDVLNEIDYLLNNYNEQDSYIPKRMTNIFIYSIPELFKALEKIIQSNINIEYHISAISSKSLLAENQTEKFENYLKELYEYVKNE